MSVAIAGSTDNMHEEVQSYMRTLTLLLSAFCVFGQSASDWPQFRGPNASGIAKSAVPTEFSQSKNLVWKQETPEGHSSPVVAGDRVFLTGFDKGASQLIVMAVSRKDGSVLWRKTLTPLGTQKTQAVSNPAAGTAVSDGERVYAYFGSYGAAAFDFDGKPVWNAPLPVLATQFGSGSSPTLAGDLLLINHDGVKDGSLVALDRKSGKTVWETKYPGPGGVESYSSPVVWKDQAIVHRVNLIEAYELKTGKRLWWVQIPTTGTSTVTTDGDTVYAAAWFQGGEADQLPPLPDFEALKKRADKNGDGEIQKDEFPDDLYIFERPEVPNVPGARMELKRFFPMLDADKNGAVSEAEWKTILMMTPTFRKDHGMIAIRPDGEGDLTARIVWREKSAIPEVPSPLVVGDRVYMVRNGGILTCLDKSTGKLIYRARVGAPGAYFASPIAAGGRVYVASNDGVVSVVEPGAELKVSSRNDLGEPIYATPAVSGDVLLVRTGKALYAFAAKAR